MEQEILDLGWCGGRSLKSSLEKEVCHLLSLEGIPHFHRPRRFQVKLDNSLIGAYSPTIIIRGKGREGKVLVIEVIESLSSTKIQKISSFRSIYKLEFYIVLITKSTFENKFSFEIADEIIPQSDLVEFIKRLSF